MKRVFNFVITALIICLTTNTLATGQEKKTEQKIKIITNDGSGSKVVLDTVIINGNINDSIKLKNGETVFIGHEGSETEMISGGDTKQVFVSVSSDGKESKKEIRRITVVNSDSLPAYEKREGNHVYVYNNSTRHDGNGDVRYRIITRDSGKDDKDREKIIYINDDKDSDNDNGETFDVPIDINEKESTVEKTKYIIAKDGIVVTVESNDEEKAKELIKEIKSKLGVENEGHDKKETIKVETKKSVKK